MRTIKLENGKEVKISEESYEALAESVKPNQLTKNLYLKENSLFYGGEEIAFMADTIFTDERESCKVYALKLYNGYGVWKDAEGHKISGKLYYTPDEDQR